MTEMPASPLLYSSFFIVKPCTADGTGTVNEIKQKLIALFHCLQSGGAQKRTSKAIGGHIITAGHLLKVHNNARGYIIYNFYNAILRSVGDTLSSLDLLFIAVLVNLGLDIHLISGLGLGIGGAALATALSQLLSAVLCVLYLKIKYPALMFGKKDCTLSRYMLMKTARYSLGAGLHQTRLYIGKMIVQGAVNTGGTAMIAAYTAAGRIEGFANSFGDSGSAATSVLTGHSYGAGEKAYQI